MIDADADSLGTRDEHGRLAPEPGRRCKEIARLAAFAGSEQTAARRGRSRHDVLHAPFAPAVVIANPSPALTNYLQERGARFPGFKVAVEATRSYPLGAFGGAFLGLLGQISQKELDAGAYKNAKAGQIVGQSGVEAAYDSILDAGFLKARIPVDSLGRIVGQLVVPTQKKPPTLQLSIDTRLQRASENAILNGMADARTAGYHPTGGSAVAIDPVDGRDQGDRELSDLQREARRDEPELPRAALQRHGDHAAAQPRDRRRVSDRLDVQADHRRGRAQRRDHHAVHAAALLRLVHARGPHFFNVERGRLRVDGCSRRRSSSRATRGSTGSATGSGQANPSEEGDADPALGAPARPRHAAADRPDRRDVRLSPVARLVLRAAHRDAVLRRARRSTSRSARARSRSARSSSPSRTRR